MNIKELRERQAELKRQGNALWTTAEKETQVMDANAKEQYMVKVRETDLDITAQLHGIKEQIEAAMRYQEDEREELRTVVNTAGATPTRSPREFTRFGQLLQAIAANAAPAFAATLTPAYREELQQKLAMYQAAASGMSVGSPSDGGFLVRADWTNEFLLRAKQAAQVLPYCRRIPIGASFDGLEYPYIDETSRVDGSRWGGVQVFWRAEATTVAAKSPKIGHGELRLEELMGLAYATERLLRDASALEAVLSAAFESELAFKVDESILRGNGAGQMFGFLNHPSLITVTRDADDLITLTNMLARMPSRMKPGAVFFHHADWLPKMIRLKIGDTPVFIPPGGLPNAPGGMLLGKPLVELEQCSGVGTVGDLIFAQMKEYVYIEKDNEGVRYDQSMHVRFLYDEMAFRWIYRINGQPIVRSAITPAYGSNSQSPFIAVAA